MAVFVLMLKDYENEQKVVYSYGPNEETVGKIEYDKKNGVINQISAIVSDSYTDDFFFKRAGRRLARIIIKENGNFVEGTTIES
ncbi:hypothetical protein JJQ72_18700 [Paenibacillus sp. F411]|uniref:hypothetical protein n=1 Tax=Paenibacillus sp. F411 TaxID=2820239 RepID=UPI001AB00F91|nr:hypothetical protein [Paenibacillus sp. F411]MBO2946012.1 hypothetical protein [Paenibacillus sp. F411]